MNAVTERQKAEEQAQVQGHLEEREAQMNRHKAEMDTLFENINAEIHDITTESSHTTSMAKTFQEQSMLNSTCTNAEQVSTTNKEEWMKEIRGGIDGVAIYRRLKGRWMHLMNGSWQQGKHYLSAIRQRGWPCFVAKGQS